MEHSSSSPETLPESESPQAGIEALPGCMEPATGDDPGYASVRKYLLYTLSLPERTLRSGAGLVGGALRESSCLLVPRAFQNSTTYSIMVRQMLDFLVEDVAGVEGPASPQNGEAPKVENYVARKAVGNFLEMAGWATFHVSPLTLLAVVSDVAYGSQAYLKELGDELKRQGVIDEKSTIHHVDDLLAAVAGASQTTATLLDTPPLSTEGLQKTIADTRQSLAGIDPAKLIPQAEVERLWSEIHELATREGVGILEISSTVTLHSLGKVGTLGSGALSGVRVAGNLFDRHILSHYSTALGDIRQRGLYATLAESSGPYIEAVWRNFSTEKATITEDLLSGKTMGQAWSAMRRWLGGSSESANATGDPAVPSEPS